MTHQHRLWIIVTITAILQHHIYKSASFVFNFQTATFIYPKGYRNKIDRLQQSANNDDNYNSGSSSSSFDDMRQLLETSWNIPTMGRIPTTPENAVDECVDAMRRCFIEQQQKVDDSPDNYVYFIDLLLPQYDISYGEKVYDEIYTAEFCIRFVQQMQIPTVIVYKDYASVNTVTRILDARANDRTTIENNNDDYGEEEEKEQIGDKITQQVVDDFSDNDIFDDIDPNIADFRKSLMQSWETTARIVDESTQIPDEERIQGGEESNSTQQKSQEQKLYYRIGSLFGNATISKGADMIEDAMMAVQSNDGLPTESEQMMIIVSPISKEEMYAIRAIVNKYDQSASKKVTIIFFNCQLQPMPQEIINGQTIYSILPLIGQAKGSSPKQSSSTTGTNSKTILQPKVVVLRRYPNNWEAYIDLGGEGGFDCIASISDDDIKFNRFSKQRGPSMEWIQSAVQRYLQSLPPPLPPKER